MRCELTASQIQHKPVEALLLGGIKFGHDTQ